MSATNVILLPSKWFSETKTIGTSREQISKPSALKNIVTVMVQASKNNSGCIYFGAGTDLTTSVGVAAELQAGQSAAFPIDLVTADEALYVISDIAAQTYFVSYYTGGEMC